MQKCFLDSDTIPDEGIKYGHGFVQANGYIYSCGGCIQEAEGDEEQEEIVYIGKKPCQEWCYFD